MGNRHTDFWLALLNLTADSDLRARLWNGYLGRKLPPRIKGQTQRKGGWPQLIVNSPSGGWPELTVDEATTIEKLAEAHGGHPESPEQVHDYMDFSGHTFSDEVDFSGLILVHSDFRETRFENKGSWADDTDFYGQTFFDHATFISHARFYKARFHAHVSFADSSFDDGASFVGVDFMGGASFRAVRFQGQVMFNDSRFEERYYPANIAPFILVDFTNARFMERTSFRETHFGSHDSMYSRNVWPERLADFSNATFMAATDFRKAAFGGAPAFFETTLHEDTDFCGIDWKQADTTHISSDYAIRAWERLELIMRRLEKPLDRHEFFRLKMRTRRRADGRFLTVPNWLFDNIADYGWGIRRAFFWWLGHWTISGLVLFATARPSVPVTENVTLALAALATGFSNAHAFFAPRSARWFSLGGPDAVGRTQRVGPAERDRHG